MEINYERELIKFQKEVLGFEKVIDAKNRKIELLEAELKRIKEGKGKELPTSETVESSRIGQSSSSSQKGELLKNKTPTSQEDSSKGVEKSDVRESILTTNSSKTIYIQKNSVDESVGSVEIILVEKEEQKSTEKRSGKTRPIHDDLQDEKRFYCKNCSSHFKRKDLLEFHKKHNCCQELQHYICKDCNKGFYSDLPYVNITTRII